MTGSCPAGVSVALLALLGAVACSSSPSGGEGAGGAAGESTLAGSGGAETGKGGGAGTASAPGGRGGSGAGGAAAGSNGASGSGALATGGGGGDVGDAGRASDGGGANGGASAGSGASGGDAGGSTGGGAGGANGGGGSAGGDPQSDAGEGSGGGTSHCDTPDDARPALREWAAEVLSGTEFGGGEPVVRRFVAPVRVAMMQGSAAQSALLADVMDTLAGVLDRSGMTLTRVTDQDESAQMLVWFTPYDTFAAVANEHGFTSYPDNLGQFYVTWDATQALTKAYVLLASDLLTGAALVHFTFERGDAGARAGLRFEHRARQHLLRGGRRRRKRSGTPLLRRVAAPPALCSPPARGRCRRGPGRFRRALGHSLTAACYLDVAATLEEMSCAEAHVGCGRSASRPPLRGSRDSR